VTLAVGPLSGADGRHRLRLAEVDGSVAVFGHGCRIPRQKSDPGSLPTVAGDLCRHGAALHHAPAVAVGDGVSRHLGQRAAVDIERTRGRRDGVADGDRRLRVDRPYPPPAGADAIATNDRPGGPSEADRFEHVADLAALDQVIATFGDVDRRVPLHAAQRGSGDRHVIDPAGDHPGRHA
jgi:hypothetical protein